MLPLLSFARAALASRGRFARKTASDFGASLSHQHITTSPPSSSSLVACCSLSGQGSKIRLADVNQQQSGIAVTMEPPNVSQVLASQRCWPLQYFIAPPELSLDETGTSGCASEPSSKQFKLLAGSSCFIEPRLAGNPMLAYLRQPTKKAIHNLLGPYYWINYNLVIENYFRYIMILYFVFLKP